MAHGHGGFLFENSGIIQASPLGKDTLMSGTSFIANLNVMFLTAHILFYSTNLFTGNLT
jgi:hypothetical protein